MTERSDERTQEFPRSTCPLPDTGEAINASTTPGVVAHSPPLIDGSLSLSLSLDSLSHRSLIIHPSSVAAVMAAAATGSRGAFISANRSLNSSRAVSLHHPSAFAYKGIPEGSPCRGRVTVSPR